MKGTNESYKIVITYFHEIIRIQKMWRPALTINNDSPSGTSVDGWRQRIERSKSVQSQFEVLCPGEQGRVKPRPVPPPQGPGGRCRGTDERGPSNSDA